jgi:hypothetical protein
MKPNNYNYDLILPFFTGDDEMRPTMQKIHKDNDGYVYATDALALIRIPSDKVQNQYKPVERFPNVSKYFNELLNKEKLQSHEIHVDDLIRVLSHAQWTKQMDYDKCPECEGKGETTCEYCGCKPECKKCRGTGRVNGRVLDFSLLRSKGRYAIKIGSLFFHSDYLFRVAVSAKIIGCDVMSYILTQEAPDRAYFKFDCVEILVVSISQSIGNIEYDVILKYHPACKQVKSQTLK